MKMTTSVFRRRLGVGVASGAIVLAVAAPARAAVVQPGPALDGWNLVAESAGESQLNVNAGWVTAATAGRGSALLPPTPGVTVGLHTDSFSGLLSSISSMKVTVKTEGSGLAPRVVLRTSEPCNFSFSIPMSGAWTTYDLTADTSAFWNNDNVSASCPAINNGSWTALKALLPVTARLDESRTDGVAAIRVLTGDSGTGSYVTTYVDSFEFNGAVSDFEAPTVSLVGATASIPAGGSIDLPVAAVLSGPNQPAFGNSLGPITGNGGLTASGQVALTAAPAGLCTLTPATFTFAPELGLSVSKARYSTAPSLKVTTAQGSGGTCTLTLTSATNATAAGQVLLTVTPTPTTTPPTTTPPTAKPTTCKATAVSKKSKIKVDMGPDLAGSANYSFRIDVKKSGAWFRYLKTMKTKGSTETRTVNVPKGTYRIKCYGPTEAQDSTSGVVKVKK